MSTKKMETGTQNLGDGAAERLSQERAKEIRIAKKSSYDLRFFRIMLIDYKKIEKTKFPRHNKIFRRIQCHLRNSAFVPTIKVERTSFLPPPQRLAILKILLSKVYTQQR